MKQQNFEIEHEAQWQQMEALLETLNNPRTAKRSQSSVALSAFPQQYRQVCHHLAMARERQYAPYLIDRLEQLVLVGHQHLYQARSYFLTQALHFIAVEFPALIRAEARLFWLSMALLYLPALLMAFTIHYAPQMVYTMLDHHRLESIEAMYDPHAAHFGRERQSDDDVLMFGHYIKNNIGISFQIFAGGLFYGLGSIFYLVYNGLMLGAIAGHLASIGYGTTFFPFVVGHGAFELTAIMLSGMAGLKLGLALLAPGNKTRLDALHDAARLSVRIIYGVTGMLLIAAFIEAFWSALQVIPPPVKYTVGALLWLMVAAYFLFMGRQRAT